LSVGAAVEESKPTAAPLRRRLCQVRNGIPAEGEAIPTTMKTYLKLAACATLMAAASSSVAADYFVRPLVSYVSPIGDAPSTDGYGVCAGTNIGQQNAHEFSFEMSLVRWHEDNPSGAAYPYAGRFYRPAIRYATYLINYRYHFGDRNAKARFYLGPAVGRTYAQLESSIFGFRTWTGDATWSTTWSGSAGVLVRVSPHVELDLGYRFVRIEGADFTLSGVPAKMGTSNSHVIYAGAGWRF
jgi:opacity protein-like surface antigen